MALIRTKLAESVLSHSPFCKLIGNKLICIFNKVNWILSNNYATCKTEDVMKLHEQCLITLLSLLEGIHVPYIPRQLLNSLNFKIMVWPLLVKYASTLPKFDFID